jgi:hypothetical protein
MATNNKINISDLDFDLIKSSLKEFMKGQDQFTDYEFEGSGLNVLMDILAYNTHYNAMYTNLAINEMFLDSASKRDSIVSIANNFGYFPTSRRSAKATVNMTVTSGNNPNKPSTLSIPKFSSFTSTLSGSDFTFYTLNESVGALSLNQSNYVFTGIELWEGTPVTEKFTVYENTKVVLSNLNIDTSTIRVSVQDVAQSLNSSAYTYVESMLNLQSDSKVYFLKEIEGGKYEIYFGKNNLGYEPAIGTVITVDYMISNGESANGVRTFTYNGSTILPGTPVFSNIVVAAGGRETETNDEIKYNVSHKFKVQNRAVTAEDYIDVIKTNYADVDAVACYGGESLTPPIYGKVFLAIKPKSGPFLVPTEKSYILQSILKPKQMLGVTAEIVDPVYNYIELETTFYYNPSLTNKTTAQLTELVRQAILNYNDISLQKFDGILRYSRLIREIDDADQSIANSITTIKIRRSIDVIFEKSVRYYVDMGNAIYYSGVPEESVLSNAFYIDNTLTNYYIDDDGQGTLRMFYYDPNTYQKVIFRSNVGTVNYSTGIVVLNNLFVYGIAESDLQLIIKPQSDDVISKNNQIVDISSLYMTINAVKETTTLSHKSASSRT